MDKSRGLWKNSSRPAMILAQVREYLAHHKRVALIDLSQHFRSDPQALRGMLAMLEQKGRVRRLPMGTPCGDGCCKCDPATVEIFEWVEGGRR
jgi:putative ferrous iron transport protein C